MPYRWMDETRGVMELRPHRSLPKRGFAVVIVLFFAMVSIPMVGVLGTKVLWGLLPFAMLALAGLWWGLQRSYRDGEIVERLEIGADHCRLTRRGPGLAAQDWQANPYWVEVRLHEQGGPVPHYVTLRGGGREVEIGAFLSEDERKRLYPELRAALARHR